MKTLKASGFIGCKIRINSIGEQKYIFFPYDTKTKIKQ